jgi:predicted RNA binding protein YcfA (HicA-like mRNA interferase family)
MPKLPRVTAKLVLRVLERDGWTVVRTAGSHQHLKHPTKLGLVTVPVHSGETLYPALLRSILRQADLTPDEFEELRK